MSELGIESIGAYVPPEGLDAVELGGRLDASPEFIDSKLGFRTLRRKAEGDETSDLCVRAYEDLQRRTDFAPEQIEAVILVSQNPDGGGIPHTSAILHHKLGLPSSAACFDVSLGCSGFVHGLSIATGFLEANGLTRALLFTADPYSKIIDANDRNTALLFGDAAACTLISNRPRYQLGASLFLTEGRFRGAIETPPEGPLRMVGNQVFRFVARLVPQQIRECLERNEMKSEDVDLFLVHQGSKYIVETLADALGAPRDKVPFVAGDIGNSVSSTLPLHLAELLEQEYPPQRILLSGFGVGLSSATTMLFRQS